MIVPLFVGREKSVRALEEVMQDDKQILLVTQREAGVDDPGPGDIYGIGTVGTILQLLKLPDGAVKVLVEGSDRAEIVSFTDRGEFLETHARVIAQTAAGPEGEGGRGFGGGLRARPFDHHAFREFRQAEQEDTSGGARLGQPDRGAG